MCIMDAPMAGPVFDVEDQADGISLAANRKRQDFQLGLVRGNRFANLKHVRAEDFVTAGAEMVGVIFHEADAALQPGAHHLHRADEGGGLPVTFRAEAVAVAHQTLDSQTGQLRQSVQIFKGGGEGFEVASFEEVAHPNFDARAITQGGMFVAAGLQGRRDLVFIEIGLDHFFDIGIAGFVDSLDQIADPVAVDIVPKLNLRLDLVAFGDGDIAHVVAEAGDLRALPVRPGGCDARPRSQLRLHIVILPVTNHHLAIESAGGCR